MVSVLSPTEQDEHAAFVTSRPAARFTHDLAWSRALSEAYGFYCEHLVVRRHGRLVAAMPVFRSRSLVLGPHLSSSPFPTYAPPLYGDIEALSVLLDAVAARTSTVRYAHLFCGDPLPEDALSIKLITRSDDLTFRLPLNASPHLVLRRLSRNIQRDVRRAAKAGVTVARAQQGAASEEFYRLYASVYAKKHGMPPHSRALFQSLARHLGMKGARVHLALVNEGCVAAVLTLWSHGEVYYAWSAADDAGRALQATTLVLSHVIAEACMEGQRVFNMGEAPKSHGSLIDFKSRWCPEIAEAYSYYLLGTAGEAPPHYYDDFGWPKKVIAMLPTSLTTRIISPLLRFVL
jgi:Acetyltransferase (GNAT) domain